MQFSERLEESEHCCKGGKIDKTNGLRMSCFPFRQ